MRTKLARFAPVALLLTGLMTSPAAAQQGTLNGRVVDAETGTPVQDVAIEVLGTGDAQAAGVLGNANGQFRLSLVSGTYSIVASRIGYESARVDGVSIAAGETTDLTIELRSNAFVLNPIVVTASRRQEKALESPASVTIVGAEAIEERAALSPVEHVKALPGVDVAQSGLSQANVVTRGFNNVFSGALLVMTDNRYASVPSLRVNAWNFIPINNLDLQRMEVVLGPGAALYGPNSASGVLHMITTSPIDDPGTRAAIAGGERSVFQGQFRTGVALSDRVGFKISGQYSQGDDWVYRDPAEVEAALDDPSNPLIGARDFEQKRWGGEARLDLRPWDDGEIIFNAGLNTAVSTIELTGQGAGQAKDWTYSYFQTRVNKGGLFAQFFLNSSNAGDTYLLRTGDRIVDESKFYATQLQYSLDVGERQELIFGVDGQWTRPETDGTITGRNEDDDSIDEIGGYVHSTTALSDQFDVVAALRIDNHNRLEDLVFSPRAALVFHPNDNQNLRFTFNRAFSTPTTNNLFLDLLARRIPITSTISYDLRTLGVPETGFTFDNLCTGGFEGLCMYSPFAAGQLPANAGVLWDGLVVPQLVAGLPATLTPFAGAIEAALRSGNPLAADLTRLMVLNTEGGQPFLPSSTPTPIEAIKPTITNTLEVGYKGILGERFLASVDLYRSQVQDFVGPLRVETPTVFFDPQGTAAYLQSLLAPVLGPAIGAENLAAVIAEMTTAAAQIPLGTVAPDQAPGPDILLTYRNFGDVSFWGADFAGQFLVTDRFSVTGGFSLVSKDCFDANEDGTVDCNGVSDIALNAPKHKGSLGARFSDVRRGITVESRARYTAGFPVNSGVYKGNLDAYTVVDANVSYQLPWLPDATVGVTATNLFDNMHREFVGAPEIGRLILTRLQVAF
ncbi:MAG: TonB-dependent receptor [Gemmatimonadota bacterium]|nr:TonB-dependent receptor [Gemmatimonadota bacterium]